MQIIETEITIHAPRAAVWKVLSDFENYHLWNGFCSKLETNRKIGDPIVMTVHMKPGKKPIIQKERLSELKAPEEMGWVLDWGFLLRTHRLQQLRQLDKNTTHYYTFDKFWGLLTPLVMRLYRKDIRQGFELTARQLKAFVENS